MPIKGKYQGLAGNEKTVPVTDRTAACFASASAFLLENESRIYPHLASLAY